LPVASDLRATTVRSKASNRELERDEVLEKHTPKAGRWMTWSMYAGFAFGNTGRLSSMLQMVICGQVSVETW